MDVKTLEDTQASFSDLNIEAVVSQLFIQTSSNNKNNQDTFELNIINGIDNFLGSNTMPPLNLLEVAAEFEETLIPDQPVPSEEYFKMLFERIVSRSVRTHSPRFIGHMTSALPNFTHPLVRVVTAMNQNVVKVETSSVTTFTERQTIAMLHRLIFEKSEPFYKAHTQNTQSTLGIMVSGGTLGNLAGLWIARNCRFNRRDNFAGIEEEGLASALAHYGYRRAVVVGSALMHYSMQKAVDILGLGTKNLIHVPVNHDGCINLQFLKKTLADCEAQGDCVLALIGTAGTTEMGTIDPLEAMADIAASRKIHFHVDAAWGGPTLFSRKHKILLKGIERADSVVIDGHKQLYTPMGCGMLLMKNPESATAIEKVSRYIIRKESADIGRRSIEGSRPINSMFIHGALHMLGRNGYEMLIDKGIECCHFFAKEIDRRPAFERLGPPILNILVYRYIPLSLRGIDLCERENRYINEVNIYIQKTQMECGNSFISRTKLAHTHYGNKVPIVALRVVLANPNTTIKDINFVLDEQEKLGEHPNF